MKKKAAKPNPLKVFNDNKAMAYKKAGGVMNAFKKSLPKAQLGPPYANAYSSWMDDPNKRAAYDARERYGAANERSFNLNEDAEKDYGRLANSYSPNGPNLDLPTEMAALNKKYPYYNNIIEAEFKGGVNNMGWEKSKEKQASKPNSSLYKEPSWKKSGGATKMKAGGSTKAAKFAALAPPYNKATAADRIAGAKKNARKKK